MNHKYHHTQDDSEHLFLSSSEVYVYKSGILSIVVYSLVVYSLVMYSLVVYSLVVYSLVMYSLVMYSPVTVNGVLVLQRLTILNKFRFASPKILTAISIKYCYYYLIVN